ncbi:hypothetical protein LXA43DRAFT_1095032 [Ganoderma leucocontextum]|nr:hypothetical protein LXA43DRAFT_1099769 [Ganoderma leucocontextum]KAI1788294.1 hypothetical protein LXA43DRAFT_1097406 [Ganoderma leucocontextum]KAI1790807.1 hypothetical protein LXA43DRAFT_1095032 [Ganoderma leucocontextum]
MESRLAEEDLHTGWGAIFEDNDDEENHNPTVSGYETVLVAREAEEAETEAGKAEARKAGKAEAGEAWEAWKAWAWWANKDDLETLLHPETGFAPHLCEICNQQLAELQEAAAAGSVSSSESDALKMESDTWALLQALMSLRKTTPPEYPHPRDLLAANPYMPPATLAQSIMHASPLLSALVVVREWLHDSAPLPATPGATNGYWWFT